MFGSSPLFSWSPRPDHHDPFATPESQSQSRFGAFQGNIRTMIAGSSIYSQSPTLGPSNNNTPKIAFRGFFNRNQRPNDEHIQPIPHGQSQEPRAPMESESPAQGQHTAGSYIHTIAPLQDPQEPATIYERQPATIYERHPADVPLPQRSLEGHRSSEDPEDDIHGRKRQRKQKKRKHDRPGHWVRRRNGRGAVMFTKGTAARGKMFACLFSGAFLLTVLSIC